MRRLILRSMLNHQQAGLQARVLQAQKSHAVFISNGSCFFYIRPLTSSDEAAYIALNAEPSAGGFASPCTTGAEEPRRIYFKRKRLFCVKCLALLLWRAG